MEKQGSLDCFAIILFKNPVSFYSVKRIYIRRETAETIKFAIFLIKSIYKYGEPRNLRDLFFYIVQSSVLFLI